MVGRSARAEQFARLLDGEAVHGLDPRVAALGRVAGRLGEVPPPALPAALVGGAAAMAAATSLASPGIAAVAPAHGAELTAGTGLKAGLGKVLAGKAIAVPAWTALVAGGAATAVAVAGVSLGASRSAPGDPFYGVKRQVERAQVAVAAGTVAAGRERLDQAETRLQELRTILAGSRPDLATVAALAADWSLAARVGLSELAGSVADPRVAGRLTDFTRTSSLELAALLHGAPSAVVMALAPAVGTLREVETRLSAALPAYVPVLPPLPAVPSLPAVPLPARPQPARPLPARPLPAPAPGLATPARPAPPRPSASPTVAVPLPPAHPGTPAATHPAPAAHPATPARPSAPVPDASLPATSPSLPVEVSSVPAPPPSPPVGVPSLPGTLPSIPGARLP